MSVSGEPPMKQMRMSMRIEYFMPFYDKNSDHDRVIVVGKKKFYVKSEELASKSEYFRILFQSEFKEKERGTIELKEISSRSFEQFLIVIDSPAKFKATRMKLTDLIATLAYFNFTEPLEVILKDESNFNKLPKKELLNLARTYALPKITEIVEDWYLAHFEYSQLGLISSYHQLKDSVEYGFTRFEIRLLNHFTRNICELRDIMSKVLNDRSPLGKKVYEKIKASVFEHYEQSERRTSVLYGFTSKMNDSQFDCIKEDVEKLIIQRLQIEGHRVISGGYWGSLSDNQIAKLEKLKAFVSDHFMQTFASSKFQSSMLELADRHNLREFMLFAIDHLTTEFPKSHKWQVIYDANLYNMDPLKIFLKRYLRENYANLSKEVKQQLEYGDGCEQFIRNAIHSKE